MIQGSSSSAAASSSIINTSADAADPPWRKSDRNTETVYEQGDKNGDNEKFDNFDHPIKQEEFRTKGFSTPTDVTNITVIGNDGKINPSVTSSATSAGDIIDEELLIPINELFLHSKYSSSTDGLSSNEATARLSRDGFNSFRDAPSTPLWLAFFYQLTNLLMILLIASASIALALNEIIEGVAILVIVAINICLAVWTEHSANSALEALLNLANPTATVVRGGQQSVVDSKTLVVGDVIVLTTGDIIPADARLISAHGLEVDEMILTGESLPVHKVVATTRESLSSSLTPHNLVLSGTSIQSGHGLALITATGPRTKLGQIAEMVSKAHASGMTEEEKDQLNIFNKFHAWVFSRRAPRTPMQEGIHRLGLWLSGLAIIICVLVFAIGLGRGHRNPGEPEEPVWLAMLLVAVSLAVSAIPEGLPLAVTISLSVGGQRLAKRKALVRQVASIENLGTVNVICTDKTGTLTEGKMSVVRMNVGGKFYDTTNINNLNKQTTGSENVGTSDNEVAVVVTEKQSNDPEYPAGITLTSRIGLLCSNAKLSGDTKLSTGLTAIGNPTEAAVVLFAAKVGIFDEAQQEVLAPKVMELPFSSSRKMMFTLHSIMAEDNVIQTLNTNEKTVSSLVSSYLVCGKGSPDMLLPSCSHYLNESGESVQLMDETRRSMILSEIDSMAGDALRVIAVVGKLLTESPCKLKSDKLSADEDEKEVDVNDDKLWQRFASNLVLIGLIGIADPAREGVAECINIARTAGIKTVMITGDYLATARAIARNINLLQDEDKNNTAVDCNLLRPNGEYLPLADLDNIIDSSCVFARAQPNDKLQIVRSLQRRGKICAMTGDGVNDSPALKQSNVGISMGSGTSVAKSASDIILLDDNFSTIISSVEEGRCIYSNIQKFIVFLVATNTVQMALIILSVIIGLPTPLAPLQILFINLCTDGLPVLALSASPAEYDLMKNKPRNPKDSVMHGKIKWLCFCHALTLICLLQLVYMIILFWSSGSVLQDDVFPDVDNTSTIQCRVYQSNPTPNYFNDSGEECAIRAIERGQTAVFLLLSLSELARAYTVRWLGNPFYYRLASNISLLLASLLSLALLLLVVFVPALQAIFETTNINWFTWLLVLGCVGITIIVDEVAKKLLIGSNPTENSNTVLIESQQVIMGAPTSSLNLSLPSVPVPIKPAVIKEIQYQTNSGRRPSGPINYSSARRVNNNITPNNTHAYTITVTPAVEIV